MTINKIEAIKNLLLQGWRQKDICKELQVSTKTIAKIKKEELEEEVIEGEGIDFIEEELNFIKIDTPKCNNSLKPKISELKSFYESKDIFGQELIKEIRKEVQIEREELINILKDIDADQDSFNELNKFITGKEKYKVTDTHYIFYKNVKDKYGVKEHKEFEIKKEVIDGIFKDFSKHGNDLSGEDIRKKYNMSPATFELIKYATGLYKGSNIISDGSLKSISEEELERIIEEAVDSRLSEKYTNKFREVWSKKKDKEFQKALSYMGQTEFLMERIQDTIENWKSRDYKEVKTSKYSAKEGVVAFGDVHMGLKTLRKDGFKLETTSEIISKRLREISGYIATKDWTKATVLFNGDLFEGMQYNMMHPMQWMEADKFGIDQLTALVDTTEQMMLDIINSGKKVTLLIKRGNHDRADTNHNDKVGIFANIFSAMVEKGLKNYIEKGLIEVKYDGEDITVFKIGRINYIAYHGDILSPKANLNMIAMRHGFTMETGMFNVIFVSHWHNNMIDEALNSLRIRLSAIVTANEYAEGLGANSLPGFTCVEESELGFPEYTQKRFSI